MGRSDQVVIEGLDYSENGVYERYSGYDELHIQIAPDLRTVLTEAIAESIARSNAKLGPSPAEIERRRQKNTRRNRSRFRARELRRQIGASALASSSPASAVASQGDLSGPDLASAIREIARSK